jgi:hypothetical protein
VTELRTLAILGIAAAGAAAIAVAAGPDLSVALLSGGAAALAAGLVVVLALVGRVRPTRGRPRPVESELLVTLRDGMTSGPIGRQRVIAALQSVERSAGIRDGIPVGAEEERRLVEMPVGEFRAWLAEQLDRLERTT